jgi:hypothetical protein
MPDSGYQIPNHGIARGAQAPRVALSFHIRAKIIVCNLNPESYSGCQNNVPLSIYCGSKRLAGQ